jgi:hypothetical protein
MNTILMQIETFTQINQILRIINYLGRGDQPNYGLSPRPNHEPTTNQPNFKNHNLVDLREGLYYIEGPHTVCAIIHKPRTA